MGSPEKKVVLKLDLHDDKGKQKAMKAASALIGIDSITMDMKDRKMTVVGVVDPVAVVSKLRKSWRTEIISIGPAKEPKKEEPKKEEEKKEEAKKEEEKKEEKKEEPKKEAEKKEEPKKEEPKEAEKKKEVAPAELVMYRAPHNPYPYVSMRYAVHSVEEDPNSCAIL